MVSKINRGLFSSASSHWATPFELYLALLVEFQFNDDPCPLHPTEDGLVRDWGSRTYCNPPYGKEIIKWVKKGYEESQKGCIVVMLVPSRTDTQWWHEYIMKATEIRFLRGRLKFGNAQNTAPFPSAVIVFGDYK